MDDIARADRPRIVVLGAGVLEPHRVAVPLRTRLPRTRMVLGTVMSLDLDERACSVADAEGRRRVVRYDRLVITCGSVTRLTAVPGVAEHALGFKSVAEALYLRDHILRQLELAEQCDDDDERAARLTFVVVGAGYTGTEVAAQGALLTQRALRHRPRLRGHQARWVLLDPASRVLPGLDAGLSGPAAKAVTRGYHLLALPGGRLRVATDWIDGTLARPPMVQFGLVPEPRLKP